MSWWRKWFAHVGRSPVLQTHGRRLIPLQLDHRSPLIDERRQAPYISNAIRTSRYTPWDFLPRQLFYQLSRLAHAYLLVVAIMQLIPGLSTTGKLTTVIPLVIFLFLIITKEGYYDLKRHRADVAENSRRVEVLRCGGPRLELLDTFQWVAIKWQDVRVGDIMALSRDEDVPADLVLLHATGENGFAFVDTMALDGETNLKAKQRPANLPDCSTIQSLAACEAELSVEDPNTDLYRFDSSLTAGNKTLPLTINEVIYRGCTVRNTPRVIGVVVNTGEECKIRMNANKEVKTKTPALEGILNRIVVALMFFVLFLATASTIGYFSWKDSFESKAWYLTGASVPFEQIFLGFIIMFNQVIPLSLYVGLEAIKLGQMTLISSDLEMYHEESDTPAEVNNTNNLDDLGQIRCIFTDKTGTLTENIMNLRRLSIMGTSWAHGGDLTSADTDTHSTTTQLLHYIRANPATDFSIQATRAVLAMALCHTCLPESADDGTIQYQGSSPDEVALVRAAQEMGFVVTKRSSQSVTVTLPDGRGNTESRVYQILDLIDFTSDRKRMSIIVRCPEGNLWLICKGADSVMLPRLANAGTGMDISQAGGDVDLGLQSQPQHMSYKPYWGIESSRGYLDRDLSNYQDDDTSILLQTNPSHSMPIRSRGHFDFVSRSSFLGIQGTIDQCAAHIDEYAVEGLRTLVYAERFLSEDEYRRWKHLFHEAETSLVDRQARIDETSELIEQSFNLLSASAIEDKLQHGVPETIDKLRRAGIKICMLTGDKRETAINIAHSARICGPGSSLHVLDAAEGRLAQHMTSLTRKLLHRNGSSYPDESSDDHVALVIDGKTLTVIQKSGAETLRHAFYRLIPRVDSVICCRASPSQKALLVTIVRDGAPLDVKPSIVSQTWTWIKGPRKPLTLAIGDGANDLAMILTASVGVGIAGREGQQAARVADFSISQFRFLSRLVLVHGRWNYHRTTLFILTTFWKEVFIYLPQALFQDKAGITGTSLYYPSALIFVSFLTAASMLVIGTWEQDLKARTLMAVPELYSYGQRGQGLNMGTFVGWMCNALISGAIAFSGCWYGYVHSETVDDNGLYAQGTMTFIVCIFWINYKILVLELHHKNKIAIFSVVGSIAALWIYQLIAGVAAAPSSGPYSAKNGLTSTFGQDFRWWSTLILVLCFLMMIEYALKALKQNSTIRAWTARIWFGEKKRSGGGVREGFYDWDTRLWQEMEKDATIERMLARLSDK
ncbi:hypothetical protein FDECE_10712 [Fusarium decemcellulare]|nr:hypothetical protein FDECE_10712 [Fusarium decemcellulare]